MHLTSNYIKKLPLKYFCFENSIKKIYLGRKGEFVLSRFDIKERIFFGSCFHKGDKIEHRGNVVSHNSSEKN